MSPTRLRQVTGFICKICQQRPIARRNVQSSRTDHPQFLVSRPLSTSTPMLARAATNKPAARHPGTAATASPRFDLAGIMDSEYALPPSSKSVDIAAQSAAEHARHAQPHRIHIYARKHNTHMTLTRPAPPPQRPDATERFRPPPPNEPVMSFAAGTIGFKKAGRGTYDAAYQLASFFFRQVQERGLLPGIKQLEVVLRGFGAGREAATKAILGQEGRLLRNKIVAVKDATRLKFGGSRSPRPRRLG